MNNVSIKERSLAYALPLFFILFLDGMGLGLLIPILNEIIIDPSVGFFMHPESASVREALYGITFGVFLLCWFFGAAVLGDLSDKIGRKRSLVICLVGTFIGFLINGFAIAFHSFTWLLIGRVIGGLASGSQSIAQAAIIDISAPEKKARNIGLILLAVCLGFTLGPLISGLLSDDKIISWFSFATPLFLGAILAILNLILLLIYYKETFVTSSDKLKVKWHLALYLFVDAFKFKEIRRLSISYVFNQIAWGTYFVFISTFMIIKYHFDDLEVAFLMGFMGVGFSVGCGYLVGVFTRFMSLKVGVFVCVVADFILALLTISFSNLVPVFLVIFLISVFQAVAYSLLVTMFSNQVDETRQGWVMGITSSLFAISWAVSSVVMGFLSAVSIYIPFIIVVVSFALCFLTILFCKAN